MAYGVYSDRGYREHILERNKNTNKTEVFTQEDQTFTGRKTFLSGVTTSDLEVRIVEVSENLKVKGKDITEIIDYLPNDVSKENKLTTEDFVNSSISTNTANFLGTFNTLEEIEALTDVTNNDYAFWKTTDTLGSVVFKRYKYIADKQEWKFEYDLNNSSFTAEQWEAINSGITAELVAKIGDGSAIEYRGNWNAETNEPPLSDGMEGATSGDFYIVSVAGSHDFGNGEVSFFVNDKVIYNKENKWEKLAGGNVRSVNGKEPDNATGNITLYGTDILVSETERINIIEKIKHYVGTTLLGRHWTQSNKTNDYFSGGARYANGIWVACGSSKNGLWYSTDGMNWTQSNKTDGNFSGGARYANGIWVACGNNGIGLWYSTDGMNWTQSNKTNGSFYGGARYANSIWVACGNGIGLWYSTDGMNWTQSNKTSGYFDGGARYANSIWVACGNGNGLWYSTDGMHWTQSNKTNGYFYGGARYANGIWVACGSNDIGLWYSTDGMNWTQSNKTNGSFDGGARYANGIWVACGSNDIGLWYSTDGMNWTQSNKTNGSFYGGARYANSIWVACGNGIGLWYSTDGMNWTQSNKTDSDFSGGARYANGIWVACGSSKNGLWYSDVQTLIDNGWLK